MRRRTGPCRMRAGTVTNPLAKSRVETEPEPCEIYGIDGGPHLQPLALDREQMRALGYRTVDALVDWLSDDDAPALRRAAPAEMAARLGTARARGGHPVRRRARDPLPRRPSVHEPLRSPALLRVRPVCGHLAGRARGLRRERVQRLRRLVAGGGGPDPARARDPRLVRAVGRLSRDRVGLARPWRLGREPDRARVRARAPGRRDARRPRDLRLRSDAFVDRAGRPHARLPARPGPRVARRRRAPATPRDARRRDRRRRTRRPEAVLRRRERRRHEHRCRRPDRGARRPVP